MNTNEPPAPFALPRTRDEGRTGEGEHKELVERLLWLDAKLAILDFETGCPSRQTIAKAIRALAGTAKEEGK